MYALGIDLGTTFTAAAVWREGRAEISSLGSRAAAIPSVVLLREDETIMTGETANRRALTAPHRVAREFKRRLGDTTPILLGGVPYSAEALMSRLLRAVVDEVSTREGGPPDAVCVSHPANWGPYKTALLHQAVRSADLEDVVFTTEPVAAAVFYAGQQRIPDDAMVAVYDLGGGTFDAAVLRKHAGQFEILGRPEGIERLGGIDFDSAVYAHVSRALGGVLEDLDDEDPATISAVARLKEECTQAKEALSADTDTTIPVLLPNVTTEVRLTRSEMEAMVRPALQDTIDALRRALRSADVTAEELHSVLLVGGSSRMPIVAQAVGSELGRPVSVDAHPKHAVALGAAWLAGDKLTATPADPPSLELPVTELPVSALLVPEEPDSRQPDEPTPGSGFGVFPVPAAGGVKAPRHPANEAVTARRTALVAMAVAVATVLVVVLGAVWVAAIYRKDDKNPRTAAGSNSAVADPTKSSPATVPADERCTDEIKANERWVCLTSATFDGETLTIWYQASFAGAEPNVDGGYHLHIYGGDGVNPSAEIEGRQAANPGKWYVEDQKPSIRKASSTNYKQAIADAPKVCARIARSTHHLVPDAHGTYVTGNCVPIRRS